MEQPAADYQLVDTVCVLLWTGVLQLRGKWKPEERRGLGGRRSIVIPARTRDLGSSMRLTSFRLLKRTSCREYSETKYNGNARRMQRAHDTTSGCRETQRRVSLVDFHWTSLDLVSDKFNAHRERHIACVVVNCID
ncbi:uncharacterized protein LOC116843175 [Odontomachus brunneus]|uniref:uncharacterized protein LOC116843175 n=1 Tax=Odontomachus brunneus TaxID=486640 RepID=UPI0013F1D197|nr:uncharacterized protein LOC116843175 [Odontomachus brunneus]XP_032669244.1 uncharacterized protein LOC116843175 [Odontomachus brunneus]XP_032669246.1 uncharacterized protein LOC116843175 [Odontomachus brunneus]XP_032669247.1 uncharacterized protein LOC116843175 [Odontomachus brunneus]